MIEFDVGGTRYRAGKLDAFAQFAVARRLAPLLGRAAPAFRGRIAAFLDAADAGRAEDAGKPLDAIDAVIEALPPVADAIAAMSDADANAILTTCLGATTRMQQGGAWTPVFVAGRLMFDDVDMIAMLQIAAKVVQENLGGFFDALPSLSRAPPGHGSSAASSGSVSPTAKTG